MSATTLVLKFGGTSLGSGARVRAAARRVGAHRRRGRRVVAVASANGHATDRIVQRLQSVAAAEPDPREVDRALATGEDLSTALLAAALRGLGIPARSVRGGEAGLLAEGPHGRGRIQRVDPTWLLALLDAGIVPVVSGFQGVRGDGETLTLGRGGSDTSAVAIAAALGPAPCHIVTDVPSVFDRDPNLHADARPLPRLDHAALCELVNHGAQVVHPGAAELARRHGVPLLIYHYQAPLSGRGGTRVDGAPVPLEEVA